MENDECPSAGLLIWSEELSVGNSVLDDDHKAFIDLATLIMEWRDDGVIASAVSMLEEYVQGHFFREEKAMRAVGYRRLAEHQLKHERFKARIKAITQMYQDGMKSAVEGLPKLVLDWFADHVLKDDLQYKNWINDGVVDGRPLAFLALEADAKQSS